MQIGEISSLYLPGTSSDETVLRQDPAPGKTDITSPHVNLLVSRGPRPEAYMMPELAGLTLAEAEGRMSAPGLKLGKLTFVADVGRATRRGHRAAYPTRLPRWRLALPSICSYLNSLQMLVLNCPLAS